MSRSSNPSLLWHEWSPGLDHDHLTLGEVLSTLPAIAEDKIPLMIRLFENPKSWIAFPGAISLPRHDIIHVLLGRGLTTQDEAFVIGFTMGSASKIRNWQLLAFQYIAQYLYRAPYAFSREDIMAFRLGANEGLSQSCTDLHLTELENEKETVLSDLRKKLKIDRNRLYGVYAYEKILLPSSKASKRLDSDLKKLDPSATVQPEGKAVDYKKS